MTHYTKLMIGIVVSLLASVLVLTFSVYFNQLWISVIWLLSFAGKLVVVGIPEINDNFAGNGEYVKLSYAIDLEKVYGIRSSSVWWFVTKLALGFWPLLCIQLLVDWYMSNESKLKGF